MKTARDLFESISIQGSKGIYTKQGYNKEGEITNPDHSELGEIMVEWITDKVRSILVFDEDEKDFYGVTLIGGSGRPNSSVIVPMDMNLEIHQVIQQQLKELGWV